MKERVGEGDMRPGDLEKDEPKDAELRHRVGDVTIETNERRMTQYRGTCAQLPSCGLDSKTLVESLLDIFRVREDLEIHGADAAETPQPLAHLGPMVVAKAHEQRLPSLVEIYVGTILRVPDAGQKIVLRGKTRQFLQRRRVENHLNQLDDVPQLGG